MAMVVEYLVILRKAGDFCDSAESFNRFLSASSSLSVSTNVLEHQGDMYGYQVKAGEVAGKAQRHFHLRITWGGNPSDQAGLDDFAACLRAVRLAVAQCNGHIEVLWDDVSTSYAHKAYPMLRELENQMRKLIATFMLTTVGREWVKEAAPTGVKDAISKSKRRPTDKVDDAVESTNVLHSIDFCHLGDILFSKYSTRPPDRLYDTLGRAGSAGDLDLADLQDYIPRSNWQRYFSGLVSCDDGYLRSRWEELYELRCVVAHNSMLSKTEFERIARLSSEVLPKLTDAIQKLPSVSVPAGEMEAVAESAARRIDESTNGFLDEWERFETLLIRRAGEKGLVLHNAYKSLDALRRLDLFDENALQSLDEVRRFRNRVVHGPLGDVHPRTIAARTSAVQALRRMLGGP